MLLLAQMALGGCKRLGKIFADEMRGKAGPIGVIAGIDGLSPCQYDWNEIGAIKITDKIQLGRHFVGAVSI